MNVAELINHPERLDRDTLYELRSMLALYPYFQTARLLMLKNLFLLHDPTFDEELRRAAIYITDRTVIFEMIEAAHYRLPQQKPAVQGEADAAQPAAPARQGNRTISLIDSFLETIPRDTDEEEEKKQKARRKPTPADAAVDYVAYLIESSSDDDTPQAEEAPQLVGHELIDTFINTDKHKIQLSDTPQLKPEIDTTPDETADKPEEGVYTETLARIYIKQHRYAKALEIIQRLSLDYPEKNAYFADQIRFIKKLIINYNKNKQ